MNSNKGKQKFFVIYQITNLLNNMIYVGAHVTYNVNDKYMGSSKYLKKDMKEHGRQNFRKDILHIFNNKEDMINKEAEVVNKEFCMRQDTYNRMVGGISDWSVLGMIPVKDKEGNYMLVYREDPRYLNGELVHNQTGNQANKGKVNVRDKDGNIFQVDKTDERWLSGELVGYSKGKPGVHGFVNKKHNQETKDKIGEANSIIQRGSGNSQFGTHWIMKDNVNKKIKKEDLDTYLEQGWLKGRKK